MSHRATKAKHICFSQCARHITQSSQVVSGGRRNIIKLSLPSVPLTLETGESSSRVDMWVGQMDTDRCGVIIKAQ